MRRMILALLVLISLCLAGASQAQERPAEPSVINLKFKGGTVQEYADALRKASDGVNIVVMPDVADVELGPIELERADLFASVMILHDLEHLTSTRRITLRVQVQPSTTGAGQSVFVVRGSLKAWSPEQEHPATSMVLTVSDLLAAETSLTAEDLLSAVEAAMELTKGILQTPDIFFHKETGLVIARGHPEQMNTIESVIDQLRSGLRLQKQDGKAEYEAEIQQLQMNLMSMDQERNLQMTRAEQRIAELEGQLLMRERQIAALQEELARLKKD